ncbi:MAG TPA: glycosyltransferase family 2 protein [Candidatus Dormibacteraeota bacterium]|nr:glycosyltransferase family 2 protein [Candidatus Dormibacteraeota bacterium]
MLTDRSISIVVPCYNEQENIRVLHERIVAVMGQLTADWELVFVDNGSRDESRVAFAEVAAQDPHVTVLSLSRNFGSQAAYSSGLDYARGKAVICMDADLQDPPELIPKLVSRWLEGYEVVYGDRIRRKAGLGMRLAYKAFYRLLRRFSYIDIPLDAGDFGLLDRRVVDIMNAMPERNRLIRGLRAWVGFRQVGVPYVRDARHAGRSSNSLIDLFRWASTGLVSYSYAPLELISLMAGVVMVLAALAIVVYTVLYFIRPGAPQGFQTLLVAVLFLGAVQLLCFSIISEYIAKIFEEVKARPKYIVASTTNATRGSGPGAKD